MADAGNIRSWFGLGLHNGIGVFIWATGSEEDLAIEADEPLLGLPMTEAKGNASAESA